MISTNRLIIKPLSLEELQWHSTSPKDFARSMSVASSLSVIDTETKDAIDNVLIPNLAKKPSNPLFWTMWLIIDTAKMAIVGALCFHGSPDENLEIEIGFGTDPVYRNQGYMTEAVSAVADWLKANTNIRSIKAETNVNNLASIKLLNKSNFKKIETKNDIVVFRQILKSNQ